MDRLSLSESHRRWQVLLQRHDQAPAVQVPTPTVGAKRPAPASSSQEDDDQEDPFDCQSLTIPPMKLLVDDVIDDFAQRWKQLDYRKIVVNPEANVTPETAQQRPEEEPNDECGNRQEERGGEKNTGGNNSESSNKKQKKKVIRETAHLVLPPQFDYATRLSGPPADTGGDRVVNLLNPSETFSYEQELWKLFQSVPTMSDIEEQIMAGHQLPHTKRICQEIEETWAANRVDGHALARLRPCNRHGMIPLPHDNNDQGEKATSKLGKRLAHNTRIESIDNSIIRFEFWRPTSRKGPSLSPDPDRAVLEFLGSQTLVDVHAAIVEIAEAGFWESVSPFKNSETNATTKHAFDTSSGCFFIEDTFYTIGSVDYAAPIQEWLAESDARRVVLRIPTSQPLSKVPMSETKLRDITWRLNTRYHHVHHGDVECSVFVTDLKHGSCITTNPSSGKQQCLSFPIVHDFWPTPAALSVECDACQKLAASILTPTRCAISQGSRALCLVCAKRLFGKKDSTHTVSRAE